MGGFAIHGDEAEEFLEPRQGLLGLLDQAQVEPKAAITAGFSVRMGVVVVDQDDRIVADQVRGAL